MGKKQASETGEVGITKLLSITTNIHRLDPKQGGGINYILYKHE